MALRHRFTAAARRVAWSSWLIGALGLGAAFASQAQPTPASAVLPVIAKAQGGQCVADPAFMRRNHMKLLKHQRDETMHGGVRGGAFSLKECVACHASATSQSVTAQPGDFCRSCHTYAAVQIDCFECHANKPSGSAHAAGVSLDAVSAQAGKTLAQNQSKP